MEFSWRLRHFCQMPSARKVTSRSGSHRDKHRRDKMPVSISVICGQLPSEERQGSVGALHRGRGHDFLEQLPLFARQAQQVSRVARLGVLHGRLEHLDGDAAVGKVGQR